MKWTSILPCRGRAISASHFSSHRPALVTHPWRPIFLVQAGRHAMMAGAGTETVEFGADTGRLWHDTGNLSEGDGFC